MPFMLRPEVLLLSYEQICVYAENRMRWSMKWFLQLKSVIIFAVITELILFRVIPFFFDIRHKNESKCNLYQLIQAQVQAPQGVNKMYVKLRNS